MMEEEDIVKWDFAKKLKRDAAIHAAMAKPQERRRRGGRPGGHRPPRPHPAVPGRARRHQEGRRSPSIDGPEGRRSVEIILAIYKAAETGRAVTLPLPADPVLKARKVGVGNL